MPESLEILRLDKGLTQKELADLAGVPQETISRIETGNQRGRPKTMQAIAKALGVKVSDIKEFRPDNPKTLAAPTISQAARYNETGGVAALPVSQ